MLILTATSGDTGSAMANAFYGLENINIAVLFPKAEVTERQRKQMTTLHDNVEVIALDGKFDDCQALVKKAFNDRELDYLNLTSANSINIGRLIPQAVYYIYAYTKLCNAAQSEEIVFSVPSGNFGNLMGGLLALKMGLPVKKFVVATNANDEVPVYFASGNYKTIVPSRNCISSAMNVGHPSNIARIVALYGGIMNENGDIIKRPDLEGMKKDMYTVSIDDMATRRALKSVHKQYNVILEPHGAVAWEGLSQFMALNHLAENSNQVFVSLETAHPAKFPEEINGLLGFSPELPASLLSLENKEEKLQDLPYNYNVFKEYLKQKYE